MSVAKVADVFVGDKNPPYSASLLTFAQKCATIEELCGSSFKLLLFFGLPAESIERRSKVWISI